MPDSFLPEGKDGTSPTTPPQWSQVKRMPDFSVHQSPALQTLNILKAGPEIWENRMGLAFNLKVSTIPENLFKNYFTVVLYTRMQFKKPEHISRYLVDQLDRKLS